MKKYTGIRFKTLALALLAENPIVTSHGSGAAIVEDVELGQFRLWIVLANYASSFDGVLPLTDLPAVRAAIEVNRTSLGKAWDCHVAATAAFNEQYNKIGRDMSADYNKRTAALREISGWASFDSGQVWRQTERDWEPAFAALRLERRASRAPAEPGPASFDFYYPSYFDDLNRRVDAIAGLTAQEELSLYAPSAAWYGLWKKYIDTNTRTEAQRMILRAFRASAEHGARLKPDDLRRNAFLRLPSATLMFRDADLTKALKFQNESVRPCPFIC